MLEGIGILMLGCGSVGQGLLPLLLGKFSIDPSRFTVIAADHAGEHVAAHFGVRYLVDPVTPENYDYLLSSHLQPGDVLLNLSVDVSSLAMIAWCRDHDVLYLDTCVEPWQGGYSDEADDPVRTTNAWLRRKALELHEPGRPTAVIAHGMNPGLISHLLREALVELARKMGVSPEKPANVLAQELGVKVIHLTERDTQDDGKPFVSGTFCNTWSSIGLFNEAYLQGAEIGWGSHERHFPEGSRVMDSIGAGTLVFDGQGKNNVLLSWTPSTGEQQGLLVSHHEVISISELLSTESYRPTVCYVYNPCRKARESLAGLRNGQTVRKFQVMTGEKLHGLDEVGVLLFHEKGALWHGATLMTAEACTLAPYNSATSLQVAAGVLGALAWMLEHPREGVVEAEDMDSAYVLEIARPYLGKVATFETFWRPGSSLEFGEFLTDKFERSDVARKIRVEGPSTRSASLKKSGPIVLWMLGIGLGVSVLSEKKSVEPLKQDEYVTREDCMRDWGGEAGNCRKVSTRSGATGYKGPRYYWDRSSGHPVVVTENGAHIPMENAHPAGSPFSHSMESVKAGTITRGGFGHFGFRSGGG